MEYTIERKKHPFPFLSLEKISESVGISRSIFVGTLITAALSMLFRLSPPFTITNL